MCWWFLGFATEHADLCILIKLHHWLTSCKSAELASRYKIVRRERGRDGKILSDHRQDGNVEAHLALIYFWFWTFFFVYRLYRGVFELGWEGGGK